MTRINVSHEIAQLKKSILSIQEDPFLLLNEILLRIELFLSEKTFCRYLFNAGNLKDHNNSPLHTKDSDDCIEFLNNRQNVHLYDLHLPENPLIHKLHRNFTFDELKDLVSRLEEEIKLPFSMHIMGYSDKMIAAKTGIDMQEVISRIDKGYGLTALYIKENAERV